MSLSNLVRVGGLAAVLAGTLLILDNWTLLLELLGAFPENFSEEALTTSFTTQPVAYLIGVLLLLVVLVGFHIRQSEAAGTSGIVGFIAALTGTGLLVSMMGTITFDASTLAVEAPALLDQEEEPPGALGFGFLLSGICAGVGLARFWGATFRAQVLPRAAAVILTIGALLIIAPLPVRCDRLEVRGTRTLYRTGRSRSPTKGAVTGRPPEAGAVTGEVSQETVSAYAGGLTFPEQSLRAHR